MKDYSFLTQTPLFTGIDGDKLNSLLTCLNAKERFYPKESFILHAQEHAGSFGIIISGEALAANDDILGNRNLLAHFGKGDLFAEAFVYAGAKLPFSVIAAADTAVLFMEAARISCPCEKRCAFHNTLIANMLNVIASKNIILTSKLDVISRRTTREKVLAFLSRQALTQGSDSFTVPFDRQGMADYLNVDRSAMSNELGKLRDEGILSFKKDAFRLLVHIEPH